MSTFSKEDQTSEISEMLFFGESPNALEIDNLLKRLELGIPEQALPSLEFFVPLLRGEYLELIKAGIKIPENLFEMNKDELKNLISADSLEAIVKEHGLS